MKSSSQIHYFDEAIAAVSAKNKCELGELQKLLRVVWAHSVAYGKLQRQRPIQNDAAQNIVAGNLGSLRKQCAKNLFVFPAHEVENKSPSVSSADANDAVLRTPKKFNNLTSEYHLILRDPYRSLKHSPFDHQVINKNYVGSLWLLIGSMMTGILCLANLPLILRFWSASDSALFFKFFKSILNLSSNFIFFYIYLRRSSIKSIYFVNYYAPANLGAIAAANCLAIETVDLQHGVQTGVIAYDRKDFYPSFVSPSRYMLWRPRETQTTLSTDILDKSESRRVLVTLQPSNDQCFIRSLSELSKVAAIVRVRLHPRRCSSAVINLVAKVGSVYSEDEWQISHPQSSSLEEDIDWCDYHVTEYSSSIIDCSRSAKLSIAVNEMARSYFPDFVDRGELMVFKSISEFLLFVDRGADAQEIS